MLRQVHPHLCLRCGEAAHYALLDDRGHVVGYYCHSEGQQCGALGLRAFDRATKARSGICPTRGEWERMEAQVRDLTARVEAADAAR